MILFNVFFFIFIGFHGSLMLVDEFYFHQKRGLKKWERLGHPIDTLFTLICYFIVVICPITSTTITLYFIFSVISCFVITKDEAVHLKYCNHYEQYLHSLLFICHPILLISLFLGWSSFSLSFLPFMNSFSSDILKFGILFQFFSIIVFLLYQIIYWNFYRLQDNNTIS